MNHLFVPLRKDTAQKMPATTFINIHVYAHKRTQHSTALRVHGWKNASTMSRYSATLINFECGNLLVSWIIHNFKQIRQKKKKKKQPNDRAGKAVSMYGHIYILIFRHSQANVLCVLLKKIKKIMKISIRSETNNHLLLDTKFLISYIF